MKIGFIGIIIIIQLIQEKNVLAQNSEWHTLHIDELNSWNSISNCKVYSEIGLLMEDSGENVITSIRPFGFHYNVITGEVCFTGTITARIEAFNQILDLATILNIQCAKGQKDSLTVFSSTSSCSSKHLFELWLNSTIHTHLVVSNTEGYVIAVYSLEEIFHDRFAIVPGSSFLSEQFKLSADDLYRANLNGKYSGDGVIPRTTLKNAQGLIAEGQVLKAEVIHYRVTVSYNDQSAEVFHQFNRHLNSDLKRTLTFRADEIISVQIDQIIALAEDRTFHLEPLNLRVIMAN
jgi:hypothetical protein